LLRYVCEEFKLIEPMRGLKETHDYIYLLNEFLLREYRDGQNAALVIDEAQNLSPDVLESVRLLSNFETTKDKLLQIVLVGQPELNDRLNTPQLRQLKQQSHCVIICDLCRLGSVNNISKTAYGAREGRLIFFCQML
jgi:general secretion pathway protein A